MTQQFYLRYLFKRNTNICPQEDLYKNARNSFIHKNQKLEIVQIPINKRKVNKLLCS